MWEENLKAFTETNVKKKVYERNLFHDRKKLYHGTTKKKEKEVKH